jgi:hypothetical protein
LSLVILWSSINSTVEISWDIFRILTNYRLHHLVNNVAIHIYTYDYIRMEITVLYLRELCPCYEHILLFFSILISISQYISEVRINIKLCYILAYYCYFFSPLWFLYRDYKIVHQFYVATCYWSGSWLKKIEECVHNRGITLEP